MKHFPILLFIFFSAVLTAQNKNSGFYKPRPKKFTPVNDYARLLTEEQRKALTQTLQDYRDSSGNVLVLITQQSLKDPSTSEVYGPGEAALHYFNNWGIGDSTKNNGVLIFVAKDDRKVHIATGKGIENVLTNYSCTLIIEQDIVPYFKQGEYFTGIDNAMKSVMNILTPPVTQSSASNSTSNDTAYSGYSSGAMFLDEYAGLIAIVVIAAVILLLVRFIKKRKSNEAMLIGSGTSQIPTKQKSIWYYLFKSFFLVNSGNTNNSGRQSHHNQFNSDSFGSSFSNHHSSSFNNSSSFDSHSSGSSGSAFGGGSSSGGGASGSW